MRMIIALAICIFFSVWGTSWVAAGKMLSAEEFQALPLAERKIAIDALSPEVAFQILKGKVELGDKAALKSFKELQKSREEIEVFCSVKSPGDDSATKDCFKTEFSAYFKYGRIILKLPKRRQLQLFRCMDKHKPDYTRGMQCFQQVANSAGVQPVVTHTETPGVKINRVYENKYGEPQALVTVTNTTGAAVKAIDVKCTFTRGGEPMGIDLRLSSALAPGESDTIRFWVKEENLGTDAASCRVVKIY